MTVIAWYFFHFVLQISYSCPYKLYIDIHHDNSIFIKIKLLFLYFYIKSYILNTHIFSEYPTFHNQTFV